MVTEEEMRLKALFDAFQYATPAARRQTMDQLKEFQGSNLESFPERYLRPGTDVRIAETPAGLRDLAKRAGNTGIAKRMLEQYGPTYLDRPSVNVRGFVNRDYPGIAHALASDSRDHTGNMADSFSYGKGFATTPGVVVHETAHVKQLLDKLGREGNEDEATFFEKEARLPVLTKHPAEESNPYLAKRLRDSFNAKDLDEYRKLPSEGAIGKALRALGLGR